MNQKTAGEPVTHSYQFAYRRSPDQDAADPVRHPVVVIGAGPVGLTLAVDLALQGLNVVLLDDSDRIGEGSRAICFAKRTLEIFDRLGVGEGLVDKGVTWQRGRVFLGEGELYDFDLLPEGGHKMPAFINIQQYYVEAALAARVGELEDFIDLRWRNRVTGVSRHSDGVTLTIETPEGDYRLAADWVVACDGSRSPVRTLMGLDFAGEAFDDRFLIADVKMTAAFPTERWFWFQPPFHAGQSALLHKQPDDVWRIDLQLGRDADIEIERQPDHVIPRIRRMLGHGDFTLEWVSIYTFQCRRLDQFVHGRVIFAGDSAHQVSPFGARGANSGVQDAENLAWKLGAMIHGEAGPGLLESYDAERGAAADENILNSTRATDFIAPPSPGEQRLRDAVLALARTTAFAKRMVNSGRLSTATTYDTALSTPDVEAWGGSARLGAPAPDVPLGLAGGRRGFLSEVVGGGFVVLTVHDHAPPVAPAGVTLMVIGTDLTDAEGLFASRFDARPGSTYLLRPDGHLTARWRSFDARAILAARRRALGL
ncbi:FAD-dependent oxidoreductase [Phreatobacter stygius]|uniref:FAD-dependent oxidoreductase n=1 Tax=Phreatobacter stygius TaxID=1940610 RepID=A0A4D7B3S3_9HYPH|nr:FAD-dependent oxidoreductase [Phreatobacter stygius]QCI67541.1 FAD-dependent oxidoreductase [Phreatobacter stygius]